MAYSIIPEPGGPFLCAEPCRHRDCAAWRRRLEALCRLCNKQMRPGDTFCSDAQEDGAIVHWVCALEAAEAPGARS